MRRFVLAFLLLSVASLGGLFITSQASAATTTTGCDEYAIMRCGADSPRQMVNKINNGAANLNYKAIYAKYGLSAADYTKFGTDARTGTIYKDGTIRVNGRVVGRSTMNLGRVRTDAFNQRVVINGQTYWGGSFDTTYHADTAQVYVLMKNGQLKFAAIASCGNPQMLAPPPAPEPEPEPEPAAYRCDELSRRELGNNRYEFKVGVTATGGANPVRAVYDFGDGDTQTVNNLSTPVRHTFTKASTVRSTVDVRLPGGEVKRISGPNCVTRVSVARTPNPPPQPPQNPSSAFCRQFEQPVLIDQDRRLYRFTVIADTSNARFTRADFRFNGSNLNTTLLAVPNGGNQATINYAFPAAGDYTITATLFFVAADNREFTGSCVATVTTSEPPAPTVECVDGKNCELTNAGPGTIAAGIFGGTTALAAAGHFVLRRKLSNA